uniref:Uncharacterized protein n=2 Tax=unclassified Caudoviricetes TaxID=2788787 RepID=A0A8S5PIT3_9CAUD|nr:MAG TPA: hypothetical protein [Siphoviridae sp. ctJcm18]DAE06632.1 MAG TPA: hypothetical protein [Siphoviridae sp. ctUGQ45]DAV73489.1 MAG TPA: hypothetical protein [Bacteriophage sp.]
MCLIFYMVFHLLSSLRQGFHLYEQLTGLEF